MPLNRLTRESRRAQGELVSYLRERLARHRDANNVRNNGPHLIEPLR